MFSAATAFVFSESKIGRSMAKFLRLDLVTPEGSKQVGKIESGEILIGREPGTPNGITIENTAISRQHAQFLRGRNCWLFKDLGSTNGSWLNGKPLKAGSWRIVRSGDVVQLADSVLQISEERGPGFAPPGSSSGMGGKALVVFSHGNFQDEFPVPEYGRALVVGGSRNDLALEGDLAELPTLVIERRGEKICAFGLAKEQKVYINDQEMSDLVALKDGDEIQVGQYSVLFSDPRTQPSANDGLRTAGGLFAGEPARASSEGPVEQTTRLSAVRGWANAEGSPANEGMLTAPKTQPRLPFGQQGIQDDPSLEETVAISPDDPRLKGTGYDRHPSTRYVEDSGPNLSLEAVEDKVIIIIGFVLLIALLGLVLWWVFA